jgi:anaerobic C4-dicarboxylate transporter
MTELNLIYGGNDPSSDYMFKSNDRKDASYQNLLKEEVNANRMASQQIYQMAAQERKDNPQQIQIAQQAQQAQQAHAAQIVSLQAAPQSPQMFQSQVMPSGQQLSNQYMLQKQMKNSGYSFFDRMSLKKDEVIKLAIFSLVIVLGIAFDRIGTHYISKYIEENILTDLQEFILRLCYPVIIFLTLWIVKSF